MYKKQRWCPDVFTCSGVDNMDLFNLINLSLGDYICCFSYFIWKCPALLVYKRKRESIEASRLKQGRQAVR